MSATSDMAKAKALRKDAQSVKNPAAKQEFLDAADRLEVRAAKSAKRVGRRYRRRPGAGAGTGSNTLFDRR